MKYTLGYRLFILYGRAIYVYILNDFIFLYLETFTAALHFLVTLKTEDPIKYDAVLDSPIVNLLKIRLDISDPSIDSYENVNIIKIPLCGFIFIND